MSGRADSAGSHTWAYLRAALITVVVLVHGVAALPVPHVVHPRELDDPVARDEVARWVERLGRVGVELTPEELGTLVVTWSGRLGRAHRQVLAPARPLFRWTGTGQGWALFANPDTHPSRLELSFLQGTDERLAYRRLDDVHDWQADVLAYRRVRGLYDATSARHRATPTVRRLAGWLLSEAPAQVDGLQLRQVATPLRLPGSRRKPKSPKERYRIEVRR
jgi:hypothetical protein